MVLSNITQPENLSVDLWWMKKDDPSSNYDECSMGTPCNVWYSARMTNHLDNNYTYEMEIYWPGMYDFFFEANDTKNDISKTYQLQWTNPVGPFEVLWLLMPIIISIAVVAWFIPWLQRMLSGGGLM